MANMSSVDVLIFVEHLARELETACLVKHYLEERHGLSVRIASSPYESHALLSQVCPRVVCVPSVRHRWNTPVNFWWDNVCIVNLAWEQILSNVNQEANRPRDEFTQTKIHYLAWGPAFRDFLTGSGVPAEHVATLGNPNFSLLEERYRFLSRDRAELASAHGLDPDKPWVFIPENYGWAFLSDAQIDVRVRAGVYDADKAHAYREFQRRNLQTLAAWLRRADGDAQIIIRPRPATPADMFAEALGREAAARVSILKNGTAREWLLAADIVMSNYSTVLVDAAVSGKAVRLICPERIPEFLHAEFLDYLPRLESEDEFRGACRNCDDGQSDDLRNYALCSFHHPGDTFTAMADWIAALHGKHAAKPRFLHGRGWYYWDKSWRRIIPFELRLVLSRLLQRDNSCVTEFDQRPFVGQTFCGDRLNREDVEKLSHRISSCLRSEILAQPC